MLERPRRNRRTPGIRAMVRETRLDPSALVLPLFVQEDENSETPIRSLPAKPGSASSVWSTGPKRPWRSVSGR